MSEILAHPNDVSLIGMQESMQRSIDALRTKLESKVSNGTILAVLQKVPCLARCFMDIKSPTYGGNVDQFYLARHDFVRIAIVDKVAQELSDGLVIGAEHAISTGKLDINITNQKIVVGKGNKTIGIEVKSGKGGVDIFQLVRYLFEVDKLIVVRVETKDVVVLERSEIIDELDRAAVLIKEKANKITAGQKYKIEGPWCHECAVECEYRKKRSTPHHTASMEGLTDFIKRTDATVEKTMIILRRMLTE